MLNASAGGEAYGCISYNNGPATAGGGGSQAYSMYIQNLSTDIKLISDNIGFNDYSYIYHVYSSSNIRNVRLDGNVAFNSGMINSTPPAGSGMIVSSVNIQGVQVTNNHFYESLSGNRAAWLGAYMTAGQDLVVTGNVFVNEFNLSGPWTNAIVSGNTFVVRPSRGHVLSTDASMGTVTWANNTHYADATAAQWSATGLSGAFGTFASWKAASGFGVSDNNPSSTPTGTWVYVRPSKYEVGRANVIVYNWAQQANVSVDLSAVLSVGQTYTVVNVQDFYGTPVASGTYAGGQISLPMTGITPPTPLNGRPYTPAPVTGPTFNVFVVMRTGS